MYNKAFELSYKNKKVEIEIQDFVGDVRNINGTEDLFSLSYISDSKDKGQSILVTEADINFYADDYFNIDELKTVGETDIKVKYYEDGILLWSGFVIPDFFSTSVDITPVVSMVATDRIGTLKEISNNAESNIPIQILASCLKQTRQDLPINLIADNNHFETPIQLERIEEIASYDVIRTFMVLFNCKITLYKNAWWVVNKKLLETGFINYKSYNSNGVGGSITPFAQPILNIDLVDRDGQREIKPTASEISLFLEFGGSKKYPKNWDFEKWNGATFDDWTAKNGFIPKLNTKQITGYTFEGGVGGAGGYYKAIYGTDILDKSLYIKTSGADGNWFGNYYTKPHLESEAEKIPFKEDFVDVTININFTTASTRALRVIPLIRKINTNPSQHEYFVIQNSGEITRVGTGSIDLDGIESLVIDDSSDGSNLLEAVQSNWEKTFRVETSKIGTNRGNPNADIRLLIFEPRLNHFSESDVDIFVHSAQFIFNKDEQTGKGLIFKIKQGGEKFSKSREPETILFSDKINQGVNGYFYNYKYDDTSIVDLPSEFALTSVRERADMFSKARDYYSLDGNFIVDPLAKYTCGLKSFVLVGGENRREDAGIIVEEIVSNTLNRTDFIYTYFDDGKDKVKSIGTASGGSSSSGGGGGGAIDVYSHTHPNKIILDTITQEMLDNALREMLGVDSLEEATDENFFSALRTLAEIIENNESLKALFLSKVDDDTAQGFIQFLQGISVEEIATLTQGLEIGDYTSGLLGGGGAFKMNKGISELEVDKLTVRMMATFFELVVSKISHIGGQLLLTPARMKCVRVEELPSVYRCYFDKGENGEAVNEFQVGDQARCQVFSGSGTKFYWRLVTAIGTDYIELSKTDKLGDSAPEIGDDIVQLGNRTNKERRNAIILSTVGDDAPSWKQYEGINSFSLEGKETTIFSSKGNRIQGKTVFVGDREETLDDWAGGVTGDLQDAQQKALDAERQAQQAIQDAENAVSDYNAKFAIQQQQLDGVVDNWFYPYTPTLANYPASDWATIEEKDRHIGDTFTNTAQYPATDAGKSWRFVKNGSVYEWTQISDSDAVLALQKASEAQSTADGKNTTFLITPSNYKLGDMWVLNADQTVNGIVYKQGDLLTATQDSETYNQAHWLKRVRYTDDTAIDNLEIGGRNLWRNSGRQYLSKAFVYYADVNKVDIKTIQGYTSFWFNESYQGTFRISSIQVKALTTYTYSFVAFLDEMSTELTSLQMTFNCYFNAVMAAKSFRISTKPTRFDLTFTSFENTTNTLPHISGGTTGVVMADFKLEKGTKPTDWTPAPEDVQASIDEAVIKATYWSIKATSPVIYKDSNSATASGVHTPVTVNGELRSGTTTTQGGFISIQPNSGAESTATASPRTIAPTNAEGKTSYTVRLYDTASKTTLLDTQTIPVVFKGASGVNAINASLSNEADVLPASPEGDVSDYSGSGTIIRVFEGATELSYGTGNGQYQVFASGSGITAGTPSTSGKTRVYGVASNMTSDNATITFTISGKISSGTSFSLTKVQTFAKSRVGQKGNDGLSVQLHRQGSFRTWWQQLSDTGTILTEPKKVSEVVGGVTFGGVDYVEVKAVIYKGSEDVTANAMKAINPARPQDGGGGEFKWYVNSDTEPKASNIDYIRLDAETYADGIDDEVRFEYNDDNAKNWFFEITFEDPEVATILHTNGLITNPTYSTKEELAEITSIGTIFQLSEITSFDEFQYFTGVTGILDNCFADCLSLTSIVIPDSVTSLGMESFSNCSSLTSIIIPDSVTSLGDYCFSDCSSLTSINIPDSVTSLGDYCFSDCSSLTSITLESITPPTITSNTFNSTVQKFFVPDGSVSAYKSATNWSAYASKIFPIT